MGKEVRDNCEQKTKTRTVKHDKYEIKNYLLETNTVTETSQILRMRLHMTRLLCNFGQAQKCPWCKQANIQTEHYFGECKRTKRSTVIWKTNM